MRRACGLSEGRDGARRAPSDSSAHVSTRWLSHLRVVTMRCRAASRAAQAARGGAHARRAGLFDHERTRNVAGVHTHGGTHARA
eukprot:1683945-Prymnesium_polylepis.1